MKLTKIEKPEVKINIKICNHCGKELRIFSKEIAIIDLTDLSSIPKIKNYIDTLCIGENKEDLCLECGEKLAKQLGKVLQSFRNKHKYSYIPENKTIKVIKT